ncbi:unnamed protein product [Caenorhabditis nigoni]|uniref:Lin-15A/B-like domain-containing protein n=1 Tax=Caenorhabditis nigoni TaxID=1611254 RepID=A0A2G5TR93_9PELO|nr:hypothetical protein B9Z55_021080 [Caenorhabditis nigoni]
MNEAVVKEEVIEGGFNFTFKNGEYVEVKQEEIEQKPEYFLEQEIKTEPIDFFENNSDELCEDVKPEPKESVSKIQKVSDKITERVCKLCHKRRPTHLLKLIKTKDEKTVVSEFFKFEGYLETMASYVCVSHIKTIIKDNEDKLKFANTPSEQRLRTFITQNIYLMEANKKSMKTWTSQRQICQVCHMVKESSQLFIAPKNIRMTIMIGFILRGTHSIDRAKAYVMAKGITCYSHRKESIDMIFEHLGVRNIEEFSKCAAFAMSDLVDIVEDIDSNFTVKQFMVAFNTLFIKKPKVSSSL